MPDILVHQGCLLNILNTLSHLEEDCDHSAYMAHDMQVCNIAL